MEERRQGKVDAQEGAPERPRGRRSTRRPRGGPGRDRGARKSPSPSVRGKSPRPASKGQKRPRPSSKDAARRIARLQLDSGGGSRKRDGRKSSPGALPPTSAQVVGKLRRQDAKIKSKMYAEIDKIQKSLDSRLKAAKVIQLGVEKYVVSRLADGFSKLLRHMRVERAREEVKRAKMQKLIARWRKHRLKQAVKRWVFSIRAYRKHLRSRRVRAATTIQRFWRQRTSYLALLQRKKRDLKNRKLVVRAAFAAHCRIARPLALQHMEEREKELALENALFLLKKRQTEEMIAMQIEDEKAYEIRQETKRAFQEIKAMRRCERESALYEKWVAAEERAVEKERRAKELRENQRAMEIADHEGKKLREYLKQVEAQAVAERLQREQMALKEEQARQAEATERMRRIAAFASRFTMRLVNKSLANVTASIKAEKEEQEKQQASKERILESPGEEVSTGAALLPEEFQAISDTATATASTNKKDDTRKDSGSEMDKKVEEEKPIVDADSHESLLLDNVNENEASIEGEVENIMDELKGLLVVEYEKCTSNSDDLGEQKLNNNIETMNNGDGCNHSDFVYDDKTERKCDCAMNSDDACIKVDEENVQDEDERKEETTVNQSLDSSSSNPGQADVGKAEEIRKQSSKVNDTSKMSPVLRRKSSLLIQRRKSSLMQRRKSALVPRRKSSIVKRRKSSVVQRRKGSVAQRRKSSVVQRRKSSVVRPLTDDAFMMIESQDLIHTDETSEGEKEEREEEAEAEAEEAEAEEAEAEEEEEEEEDDEETWDEMSDAEYESEEEYEEEDEDELTPEELYNLAATMIQCAYRAAKARYKCLLKIHQKRMDDEQAACVEIQRIWRSKLVRLRFSNEQFVKLTEQIHQDYLNAYKHERLQRAWQDALKTKLEEEKMDGRILHSERSESVRQATKADKENDRAQQLHDSWQRIKPNPLHAALDGSDVYYYNQSLVASEWGQPPGFFDHAEEKRRAEFWRVPPNPDELAAYQHAWIRTAAENGREVLFYNTLSGEYAGEMPMGFKEPVDVSSEDLAPQDYAPDGRLVFCGLCQAQVARLRCCQCGPFFPYCLRCFLTSHGHASLREHDVEHIRDADEHMELEYEEPVPPSPVPVDDTLCSECQCAVATLICEQCGDQMCQPCFDQLHSVGNRSKHTWTAYNGFLWEEYYDPDTDTCKYFQTETREYTDVCPVELMFGPERREFLQKQAEEKRTAKEQAKLKELRDRIKDLREYRENVVAQEEERQRLQAQVAQATSKTRKVAKFIAPSLVKDHVADPLDDPSVQFKGSKLGTGKRNMVQRTFGRRRDDRALQDAEYLQKMMLGKSSRRTHVGGND